MEVVHQNPQAKISLHVLWAIPSARSVQSYKIHRLLKPFLQGDPQPQAAQTQLGKCCVKAPLLDQGSKWNSRAELEEARIGPEVFLVICSRFCAVISTSYVPYRSPRVNPVTKQSCLGGWLAALPARLEGAASSNHPASRPLSSPPARPTICCMTKRSDHFHPGLQKGSSATQAD